MTYKLICGLEIHTELKTKSKMFCGCKNDPFLAPKPNIYTCPVCLGMPGGLPVANQRAIEWTIKLGLFLQCQINLQSHFDRKNYFYPDLPKGYQISQDELPFCFAGRVDTPEGVVRINRIHLEEDTGKLLHQTIKGQKVTLIDFNRSGVPLVEIVTEPDIISSNQAVFYAQQIRSAVRLLGIGDADMQKGAMRLEANISLQTPAQAQSGVLPDYKVEVKNINSFNFMKQAIDYEIARQKALLDQGLRVKQETRGWDSKRGRTFVQRQKDNANGYGYFPEPDLPPIILSAEQIEKWRAELPLSTAEVLKQWQKKYQLSAKYGQAFVTSKNAIQWAQALWQEAQQQKIKVDQLANFLVNKKIVYDEGEAPKTIITKYQQLQQVDEVSEQALQEMVQTVLSQWSKEVKRYQAGETKLLGFFMGQVLKVGQKKLAPEQVRKILTQELTIK